MNRNYIIHHFEDWSIVNNLNDLFNELDLSNLEFNLGIHKYNGKYWSSGYVGVGRLYDRKGHVLQESGKEHIAIITSQYGLDPWYMLETVMKDNEYDNYIAEMDAEGKTLFQVFYDQPLIKLSQDTQNNGEILFAISYIKACYNLCKKGLKKSLVQKEENLSAKIRGKIEVKKNLQKNSLKGRNDRFFCRYIDFTEDNIENRILKTTLSKCKKIIEMRFSLTHEITKQFTYCMNAFRHVRTIQIKLNDFNEADASGLYMYYKPLLQQAKCIYKQKYYHYKDSEGKSITKSVYTIPHVINMETLLVLPFINVAI